MRAVFSREILQSCKEFDKQHITVFQYLLDSNIPPRTFYNLIELMASKSEEFSNNKMFGKLLVTIIQLLGRYVLPVEQLLKVVIEKHKSVWKIEAEKLLNTYHESSQLSQSLIKN